MIELQVHQIKNLPIQFIGRGEVRGFKFSQICVNKSGFIYEVDTGSTLYYEIFKRRVNRRFATISYPGSNSFSIWAWTTPDFDRALEMLDSFRN